MNKITDRQRQAACGCVYDCVTGTIMQYCDKVDKCAFFKERLAILGVIANLQLVRDIEDILLECSESRTTDTGSLIEVVSMNEAAVAITKYLTDKHLLCGEAGCGSRTVAMP